MNNLHSFKKTQIEWIKKIPSDWEIKKIKHTFWERKEKNDPIKSENLISLTISSGVIPHSEKTGGGNKPKEDLTKYKLVYPGDIVLNSMNVIAGAVGISKYYGVVSPVYYMLIPRDDSFTKKFFHYVFRNETFQKSLYGLGNGILIKENEETGKLNTIRMRIPMDKLGDQFIPVPSRKEQKLISLYLDKKTKKINLMIEKIHQKIRLLKEEYISVINQCVTRGLESNVKMKDSGIEFINEIPKHWNLSKIKYLSSLISKGTTPSTVGGDTNEIGDVKYLKSENIVNGTVVSEPIFFISSETDELIKRSRLKEKDVLVVIAGAMVGKTAIMKSEFLPANTNQAVAFVRPKSDWYSEIIYFWMSSLYIKMKINETAVVSAQPNLSMENLGNFDIVLPPEQEWFKISKFLKKSSMIKNNILKKEFKRIKLLEEYKQSLIYLTVTGKVKIQEEMK
jgi:type I restriction enzyme, S subunit